MIGITPLVLLKLVYCIAFATVADLGILVATDARPTTTVKRDVSSGHNGTRPVYPLLPQSYPWFPRD